MKKTVLVADDERSITDLVAFALELEGYRVIQAFDGPSALKQVEVEHPQLIMLDIMMPGMDGRDVSRRLKQNPITKGIPILLFSAAPNPDLRRAQADAYLPKPFDLDRLIETVRRLLKNDRQPAHD